MSETKHTPEELALRFHEAYERLAPSFGYETRPETCTFDPDSSNGCLMLAVCRELLGAVPDPAAYRTAVDRLVDAADKTVQSVMTFYEADRKSAVPTLHAHVRREVFSSANDLRHALAALREQENK